MRNKKLITIFMVLFLSLLVLVSNPVKADTGYDWINNGSFEDINLGNLINDGGFETGVFTDWVSVASATIESDNPISGDYSLKASAFSGSGAEQNLTEPTLGEYITTFTCYIYKGSTGYSFVARIYYTDASTTSIDCDKDIEGYEVFQLASYINDTATVYKIGFYRDTTHSVTQTLYLDAVWIGTSLGNGQIDIEVDSYPWFSYWDNFGDESYIGITNTESNTGVYSAYLTYLNSPYRYNMKFTQKINYLQVDNVTGISFYAKTDSSSNVLIQAWLYYSDLTSEMDSNDIGYFNSTSGWTAFDFTDYYASGKLIISIEFAVVSGDYGDRTYFDDIVFNATTSPTTGQRFTYYTVPSMNSSNSGFVLTALTKTNYVFYGTFYDVNGTATDSGTFTATSSKATQEGTVSYGQFHFNIVQRGSEYDNTNEILTITLNIDGEGVYVFQFTIIWFDNWTIWNYTPPPTSTPTNPYQSPIVDVIIQLVILIFPSAIFAGACFESKSIDPLFGIIAGLMCSAFIYYIAFNNILGVIICVLVMGFLIFGTRHRGNTPNE